MKQGSILCLLMAVLLWGGLSACAAEEARSLYIGDIVTLQLEGQGLTEESVRHAFEAFEILSLDQTPEGPRLSLRTFEAGEHKAVLGNKEIILDVRSTLEELSREDVFEGSPEVVQAGFSFPWRILLYAAAGVFVLSGVWVLAGGIRRRKAKQETAYARFVRRSALLSPQDGHYFVALTFYFKEYIESLLGRRVIGDTSAEIIQALEAAQAYSPLLPDIQTWLLECDRMKFSGADVPREDKQRHASCLMALVESMEKHPSRTDEEKT